MIDFANYTPAPNDAAASIQVQAADVGRNGVSTLVMQLFPGVIDSAVFVLILLAIFLIAAPIIVWLLYTGRVKNG